MNDTKIQGSGLCANGNRFFPALRRLLCVAAFILEITPALAGAQVITVRADSWFPFNGDPKSEHPGYMIEVAKSVFAKQGMTLDYQITPWTRSISLVESGAIDGIVGAGKKETPGFVFPEEPLAIIQYSVFTLADSKWKFDGIESLKGIFLGAIADYSYAESMDGYLEAHKTDGKLIRLATGDTALEQNIEMLIRNRIGGVVSNREVFYATVDGLKMPREKFKEAAIMPEADPLFIAFSPKKETSAKYAKILSDGIAQLRESGELGKILAWYKLNDWK